MFLLLSTVNHIHFLNSARRSPGVVSCAVDCFLEVLSAVLLPYLTSDLEVREFLEQVRHTLEEYDGLKITHILLTQEIV